MAKVLTKVGHRLFKEKFTYDTSFNLYEFIARSIYYDLIESESSQIDNILTGSEYNFFLALSQDMNRDLYRGEAEAPRCNPKTHRPPCKMSKLEDDPHRLYHPCIEFPLLVDDSDGHDYRISLTFKDGTKMDYEKSGVHYGYQQPIAIYSLKEAVSTNYIGEQVTLTIEDRFVDYPQLDPIIYTYSFRLTEKPWTSDLLKQKQRQPAKIE